MLTPAKLHPPNPKSTHFLSIQKHTNQLVSHEPPNQQPPSSRLASPFSCSPTLLPWEGRRAEEHFPASPTSQAAVPCVSPGVTAGPRRLQPDRDTLHLLERRRGWCGPTDHIWGETTAAQQTSMAGLAVWDRVESLRAGVWRRRMAQAQAYGMEGKADTGLHHLFSAAYPESTPRGQAGRPCGRRRRTPRTTRTRPAWP